MRPYQLIITSSGIALEAVLLLGILKRGRAGVCLTFPIYVAAVMLPSVMFAVWPARFYTWDNYILKEIVHTLLKFTIALELAYRTFRAFPGAFLTGRRVVLLAFVVLTVVALTAAAPGAPPSDVQLEWHARTLSGTIWLFTAIAVVILWYRLPVDPFHKAILVGFVPYLLIFSIGMRAFAELGEDARLLQRAHTLAYVVLLAYWTRAAWAPAREPVSARRRVPATQPA